MKIILLGPPGAGKGTVARAMMQVNGSVQISTGDILRAAIAEGSEIGRQVEALMAEGSLVTDDLIMSIMEDRLQQPDCQKGYLLDGFPRTIPQAVALKSLLARLGETLDCALELDIPRDVLIDRLTTRRTCTNCGEIYNTKTKPPQVEGVCDVCGGDVVQRDDETEEAIEHRLEVYKEQTAPLVEFYRNEGLLVTVKKADLETVQAAIADFLQS